MGFADDPLIPLVDEGLGNSAYLIGLGDGRAGRTVLAGGPAQYAAAHGQHLTDGTEGDRP